MKATPGGSSERFFESADGLRLFYRDHAPHSPNGRLPVICLPGLTRNSRDFTEVAGRLNAAGRRVLCADLRGRGLSQHDSNWKNYHPGTYVGDVLRLLEHAGEGRAVFLGTSLGGILTMMMAALKPDAVAAAILNDVGPEVAPEGLARIASYVGRHAPPRNWDEAVAIVRSTYEVSLPGLSDAQWELHARRSYSEADGVPRLDMDPMIGEAVRGAPAAAAPDLWPLYGALRDVPTLAIRGATSDILAPATFERMRREKPDLVRVEVPDRGHVPLLDEPACVAAIDAFLARVP
jgi:pimeloyl-ACP methyl ester carboxylesterase